MKKLFLILIIICAYETVGAESEDADNAENTHVNKPEEQPDVDVNKGFTIDRYLKGILQNDLAFKVNKQQLKIVQSQYISDKSSFISEIIGDSSRSDNASDTSSNIINSNTINSNVSLLQGVGFGGSFNLSYSSIDSREDYFVQYTQQLINNAFGRDNRIRARKSKHLLDAERIMLENYKAGLCQAETRKYMDTLALQKTLEINKQTMDDAKVALDTVTRAYNRRLITRDAFLSAETDFLETKQSYEEMQANLKLQKKTMALLSKNEVNELLEPQAVESFSTSEIKDQMEAYELRVKASELEVKLLPSWQKPDVGLIFKAGQNTFNEVNDNYIMVGMNLRWPIYNRKLFEAVNQSLSNYEIANLNLKLRGQQLEQQKLVIDTNLQNLKTKIATLTEVTENSKEQLALAFNKLKLGQIEFEDYLLIRNKLNRELIDLVTSRSQFFVESFNHLVINNKLPSYCI